MGPKDNEEIYSAELIQDDSPERLGEEGEVLPEVLTVVDGAALAFR